MSALETGRQRLGEDAHAVHLLRENVISGWNASRRSGLWRDPAVFHFFLDEANRTTRYRNVLRSALWDDGEAIVATCRGGRPGALLGATGRPVRTRRARGGVGRRRWDGDESA